MEKQSNSLKPADARIVQAVRKLKSSKDVDQSEVRKNQEEIKQSKNIIANKPQTLDNTIINLKKAKKALTPITQNTKTNITNNNLMNINNTNNNPHNILIKKDINKSNSKIRISIDGNAQKPNTGSTNKTSKTFDYETLKKYKKRQKSDYQKNLLSKKSIDKYKEECVNLIKKEPEKKKHIIQI